MDICNLMFILFSHGSFYQVEMSQTMKLDLDIDNRHAVIQRRYEAWGAINDLLIAIWFLVGSLFFLNEPLVESGNWMFVISG